MDIIKLEISQKRRAAEVAAAAFFDYPMMKYYFPDVKKRKQRLLWYMKKTIACAMRYGEVSITADCDGVMFVLPPAHTRLNNKEFIQGGFLFAPFVLGLRNYIKSSECEKFVADTQEHLLNGREHYYLWGLVTDPQAQGSGVGSALLKELTDKADVENLPVYLETHEQKNVAYYERFGFRLIHTAVIPLHGLDIWCMLREAENK